MWILNIEKRKRKKQRDKEGDETMRSRKSLSKKGRRGMNFLDYISGEMPANWIIIRLFSSQFLDKRC